MLKQGILYYYPPENPQTFQGDELDKLIYHAQSLGIIKKEGKNDWHYNGFNIKGRPNLKKLLEDETKKSDLETKIQATLFEGNAERLLNRAKEDYYQKLDRYPDLACLSVEDWKEDFKCGFKEVYVEEKRIHKNQVFVGESALQPIEVIDIE
jgi:hypothetical protein